MTRGAFSVEPSTSDSGILLFCRSRRWPSRAARRRVRSSRCGDLPPGRCSRPPCAGCRRPRTCSAAPAGPGHAVGSPLADGWPAEASRIPNAQFLEEMRVGTLSLSRRLARVDAGWPRLRVVGRPVPTARTCRCRGGDRSRHHDAQDPLIRLGRITAAIAVARRDVPARGIEAAAARGVLATRCATSARCDSSCTGHAHVASRSGDAFAVP